MILHIDEWICVEVAEVLDIRLHTPVISIRLEKLMAVKEPRVESTHIAIRDAATVKYVLSNHLRSSDHSAGFVDVLWLIPMVVRDLAKLHFGVSQDGNAAW